MTTLSALTLLRNRQAHLDRLVEGLTLSASPLDELIVIDMSDAPVAVLFRLFRLSDCSPAPIRITPVLTSRTPSKYLKRLRPTKVRP